MAISKSKRTIEFILTAKDKTKAGFRKAQTGINKFHKSAAGLASSLGLAFAGGGIIAGIKRTVDAMDRIGKVSTKLGITTEALSELRYAAKLAGVDSNTLDMGLQRMVRRLSEAAKGTGEAKDALIEMGLSAAALGEMSADEQIRKIADAMGDFGNRNDQIRLAFKLFDSGGVQFLNFLDKGSKGLDEAAEALGKYGGAVTEEGAKATADFNDNLNNLQARLDLISQTIVTKMVPNWNEWIDLIYGTPLELVGDTELVTKELQEMSHAIVSIKAELDRLRSTPYFGHHSALYGDTQNINAHINDLEKSLLDHEKEKARIIQSSFVERANDRKEQNEREHNREMAAVRKEATKQLSAELKAKEAEFKRHEAALAASRDRQKALLQEVTDAIKGINDFGKETEPPDLFDIVEATGAAWDKINQGDAGGAREAIRALIDMFREYQETGKASSASVGVMVDDLERLAEATNNLEAKGLEERAVRAAAAAQDLKDEIESKPIGVNVGAAEGSGKVVRDQTQEQILLEQPIIVQVGIQLAGQIWGTGSPGTQTVPYPGAPTVPYPGSDVETESNKRGFRL